MTRLVVALVATSAALALSSCGGGDDDKPSGGGGAAPSSDAKADALIARAAGPNAKAHSGVISGEIEVTIKGVSAFAEPFTASIEGPFSFRKGAELPDYEIDLGARGYGVELSSVNGSPT